MNDHARERFRALCDQLEVEQDMERFADLIREINLLLDKAEKRLRESPPGKT